MSKPRKFVLDKRSDALMYIIDPYPFSNSLDGYEFVERIEVVEKSAADKLAKQIELMAGMAGNIDPLLACRNIAFTGRQALKDYGWKV